MKLTDLDDLTTSKQLDEAGLLRKAGRAISDYVDSSGLTGKNRMAAAAGRSEKQRQDYAFQRMFYSELEQGLESAVQSGMVQIAPQSQAPSTQQSPSTQQTQQAQQSPQAQQQGGTVAQTDPDAAAKKLAQGQAEQQQAIKQMKATQASNAAKSDDDEQIRRAASAARAKPGFQQTATDRQAIKTAARRGIKETTAYEQFDALLESKILNENTISNYIVQFVGRETRNLVDNPQYTARVQAIAKQIEASITAAVQRGKIKTGDNFDVSGNKEFVTGAKQLGSLIAAWSKLGSRQSQQSSSTDANNNGVPDTEEREEFKKSILTQISNLDFNDKSSIPTLVNLVRSIADFVGKSKK
jgi:hypothetical protein